MLKTNHRFKILLVCLLTFFARPALADTLKDRIDQLEKMILDMQNSSIERNEKVASAISVIDQVRQEYQAIQGTLDANNHLIQEQQSEIDRLRRDVSDRFSSVEDRLELYNIQITRAVEKVLPQAASEAEAYQKGLDFVQKSDFLTAVSVFKNFLKVYPKSDLADNAQYWTGECYYALKDYPKAIKEFQVVVDKYSKGDKTAGAILKQGYSFAEMGMLEESKPFLNRVMKEFSGSDEAVRAKEKLDRVQQKAEPPEPPSSIPLAPGVKPQTPTE